MRKILTIEDEKPQKSLFRGVSITNLKESFGEYHIACYICTRIFILTTLIIKKQYGHINQKDISLLRRRLSRHDVGANLVVDYRYQTLRDVRYFEIVLLSTHAQRNS